MPASGELGQTPKKKKVQEGPEVGIDLKTRLSKSEYNKRGWTLQELTLSRKALIFVDNQVFFRCQGANWDETSSANKASSLVGGDINEPRICGLPDPVHNILPCLSVYLELFEEYSRRELRYDGDALRAFYGLIRPLFAGMQTPSVEGLPGYYVNAFMLFTSPGANLRRRREFASFSWTGWAGELKWPRENLIWYDEDGQRTQSLSNIFRWLYRNEIAEWSVSKTAVDQGRIEVLANGWRRLKGVSNLVELLKKYPHLFDNETVEARKWYMHRRTMAIYSPGLVWED